MEASAVPQSIVPLDDAVVESLVKNDMPFAYIWIFTIRVKVNLMCTGFPAFHM